MRCRFCRQKSKRCVVIQLVNDALSSRIYLRTQALEEVVKKVEEAIKSGDKKAAAEALRAAQPEIQRGAAKHIVTKNAAARRVSRLAARIKAMA